MPALRVPPRSAARLPVLPPVDDLTRRDLLRGAVALLVAAGCDAASDPAAAPPATTASSRVFSHRYGQTELQGVPERVVTVGLTDHDAFLALGIAPVGVTDWYGDHPHAVWPWAVAALGDAAPTLVGSATELDFEQIAALEPDVIVGLYAALDQATYDTLSQIAPTIAQPDEHVDYGVPWQELTRTVGRILDREDAAAELVAAVEARFADARAAHPAFDGASAAIATPFEGIYVYSFQVANGRVLSTLGFSQPAELAELIGDADGTSLSPERVDLLDLDLLVWLDAIPGEGPLAQPTYSNLDVHTQGREVFVDSTSTLGGALSFSSVLSLPAVLDALVPMLAAAVDGDPATTVPEAS